MTTAVRSPCIATARVRLAVLAAIAIGHLPVPVFHAHAAMHDAPRLAQHVARFHGSNGVDSARVHVHVVPAFFFIGGGLADLTGDDVPDPPSREVVSPDLVQVDAPVGALRVSDDLCATRPTEAQGSTCPRQFLGTFARSADLVALLGVCRC